MAELYERRESYHDYMMRRIREEDAKMKKNTMDLQKDLAGETLDLIAKDVMLWHYSSLCEDMRKFESEEGWVHKDDYMRYISLRRSFIDVLDYFGIDVSKKD